MIRTGILFLVGLLLTGCNANQMTAKKVGGLKVNNIKSVESVASDKLNDIEKWNDADGNLRHLKELISGYTTREK